MTLLIDDFYLKLPAFTKFDDCTQAAHYSSIPSDWAVAITDVQGSTRAILDGKYRTVNSLGAASIIAVLNAVKPLKVPFVFGGDGATFCVPASARDKVAAALVGTKKMAQSSFGLSLRIGIVDIGTIRRAGHDVFVGKFRPSDHYEQAMFKGDGLSFAEDLVKDPHPRNRFLIDETTTDGQADFTGFECRWNEVPSPHGEIVSILVKAIDCNGVCSNDVYADVLRDIRRIYGEETDHHPLRESLLSLALSPRKLLGEAKVRAGSSFWVRCQYLLRLMFLGVGGKWVLRYRIKTATADWGSYKSSLIANTDYRKFDGVLRMVIAGNSGQRERLRDQLEERRRSGTIVFGMHAGPKALMTCLVRDYNNDHVHFVDGSSGGYALAAQEMKKQLGDIEQQSLNLSAIQNEIHRLMY